MPTTTTLSGNQPAMSKLIRHKDPNTHLPRFETNNSMGHHCGVCGVPLTNPSCIRKCIGVHEAICPQFHPLFHRIGCVHKCKACKRQKEAVHSRHADIGLKIQELKSFSESRITAAAEKESWSPTVKVPKRERKLEKSAARAQLRAQASQNITTKYLGELASILYPTAEAEALLNQTFCDDFQKQDTDDQRIIDSIMAPMREKPNYDAEVNRVLRELKVIAGHSRQEKILHEKIVVAVKQDMVTTYNTYVNLYRRRTQYALWITKGAALNTAWGEEVSGTFP
ncbi:hypothetical protein EJ08DRAFT_442348 [Tothia fuscella]|uniref:Uncharacterized protein n=1 Tax=Tothia fuscella TaxID=1048955 RepID=A0A9P4NJR4_9PEZI|nr:hypothetical protein EJ08DRAFT_442348 [Tothia fuscella]